MKDYDVFKKWLGGVLDLIWGTPSMAQKALEKEMKMMYTKQKPKRKRGKNNGIRIYRNTRRLLGMFT